MKDFGLARLFLTLLSFLLRSKDFSIILLRSRNLDSIICFQITPFHLYSWSIFRYSVPVLFHVLRRYHFKFETCLNKHCSRRCNHHAKFQLKLELMKLTSVVALIVNSSGLASHTSNNVQYLIEVYKCWDLL